MFFLLTEGTSIDPFFINVRDLSEGFRILVDMVTTHGSEQRRLFKASDFSDDDFVGNTFECSLDFTAVGEKNVDLVPMCECLIFNKFCLFE